jgi:hypothetical protein
LLACALGNARVVHAHDVDTGVARRGEVRLPVSCNVAAQKEFEVAMAYYHSLGPDLAARGKPPFFRRGGQREPSYGFGSHIAPGAFTDDHEHAVWNERA